MVSFESELNVLLNFSTVIINHSNTNLFTTIKQTIGSMILASSHLNINTDIFVGGFSNIFFYLTSTFDVWGSIEYIIFEPPKMTCDPDQIFSAQGLALDHRPLAILPLWMKP